jgi:hypothetical protein
LKNLMIDTETLGTTADAVIMSIGAVKFDLDRGELGDTFYASISLDSNLRHGRTISEETLKWWLKQSPEAQGVFYEEKGTLLYALCELSRWVGVDNPKVWSNGADFDLPMLAHAYHQTGANIPWRFWNSRCFRTYKNLPGAKAVAVPPHGVKHNALSDAIQQAQHACAIHQALFSGKATS